MIDIGVKIQDSPAGVRVQIVARGAAKTPGEQIYLNAMREAIETGAGCAAVMVEKHSAANPPAETPAPLSADATVIGALPGTPAAAAIDTSKGPPPPPQFSVFAQGLVAAVRNQEQEAAGQMFAASCARLVEEHCNAFAEQMIAFGRWQAEQLNKGGS